MKISERARRLGTENAFQVSAEIERLARESRKIVPFHIGQPDFRTPELICEAAVAAIKEGKHGYTPSPGMMPLREAIADFFSRTRKIPVSPTSIVVDNGAKPFIGNVIESVTDFGKGEEVIYPCPGFPIYHSQITDKGAVPVAWKQQGECFAPEDLTALVTKNTKLLILSSPHNPAGYTFNRKELEQIAEIACQHDLWVYSDEPYSGLVYDTEFTSIASLPEMQERTIMVDGVSKRYAMTGWRIGFAANEILAPALSKRVTNTTSCPNHISQYAALAALTGTQEEAERMRQTFRERRNLMVKKLNEIEGIYCPLPGGAFYVWPEVSGLCRRLGLNGSDELQQKLLYEAGVAVLSDKHFVPAGIKLEGEHLRLAYTLSSTEIEEGIEQIKDYIRQGPIS